MKVLIFAIDENMQYLPLLTFGDLTVANPTSLQRFLWQQSFFLEDQPTFPKGFVNCVVSLAPKQLRYCAFLVGCHRLESCCMQRTYMTTHEALGALLTTVTDLYYQLAPPVILSRHSVSLYMR